MHKTAKLWSFVTKGLLLPTSLILAGQAVALHMLTLPERELPVPGLHTVPVQLGPWKELDEQTMAPEVTEYLKPDDYILRDYARGGTGDSINLFVAYFKSLQTNYGPHSPKVCMPGAGWLVRSSAVAAVPVPGRSQGIPVNQYVLEKSDERILMLYWYQNNRMIWADEFQGKLKLLPDLVRYRRSDVSLVRLVTPMHGIVAGDALRNCLEFTRLIFPPLVDRFANAQ